MSAPLHRRPVPRALAVFLPPLMALLLAVAFTQWQAHDARASAQALCAGFKPGDSLHDFVSAARAADFDVQEPNAEALTVIAQKDVWRIHHEGYRCSAHHEGGRVLSTKATFVILE
jgi:hypothetical protein